MRHAVVFILALVLGAGVASAQKGEVGKSSDLVGMLGFVGVFADPDGFDCTLSDLVPGVNQYYVVHSWTTGALEVQYKAKLPLCMTQYGSFWLADANMFADTWGNSQDGVRIAYGSCRQAPITLQSILVWGNGATPNCCRWYVTDNSEYQTRTIEGLDCDSNVIYGIGGETIVNERPKCHACGVVPIEPTTWGGVKALYGE